MSIYDLEKRFVNIMTVSIVISVQQFDVKLSVIARGISVGDELEYTDELTLGRSIVNRVPFE